MTDEVAFTKRSLPRLLIPILSFLGFILCPFVSEATFTSPAPVYGYAWSENIGWISFNCDQTAVGGSDVCATSNYGVQIEPDTDGDGEYMMTGYAWSEHIGWIKFGGLGSFPSGSTYGDARMIRNDWNDYELVGWARACAPLVSLNCATATVDTNAGGWDGWISLSCKNVGDCSTSNYSIQLGDGDFGTNSYAWGSTVVGWVAFGLTGHDLTFFEEPCPYNGVCIPDGVSTNRTLAERTDSFCEIMTVDCVAALGAGGFCSERTGHPSGAACVTLGDGSSFDADPRALSTDQQSALTWTIPLAIDARVQQNAADVASGVDGTGSGSGTSNPITASTDVVLFGTNEWGTEYEIDRIRLEYVPQFVDF